MAIRTDVPADESEVLSGEVDIEKFKEEAEEFERRIEILSGNISGIERMLERPELEEQKRAGLKYHLAKARQKMQKLQENQGQLMDFTRI